MHVHLLMAAVGSHDMHTGIKLIETYFITDRTFIFPHIIKMKKHFSGEPIHTFCIVINPVHGNKSEKVSNSVHALGEPA